MFLEVFFLESPSKQPLAFLEGRNDTKRWARHASTADHGSTVGVSSPP